MSCIFDIKINSPLLKSLLKIHVQVTSIIDEYFRTRHTSFKNIKLYSLRLKTALWASIWFTWPDTPCSLKHTTVFTSVLVNICLSLEANSSTSHLTVGLSWKFLQGWNEIAWLTKGLVILNNKLLEKFTESFKVLKNLYRFYLDMYYPFYKFLQN